MGFGGKPLPVLRRGRASSLPRGPAPRWMAAAAASPPLPLRRSMAQERARPDPEVKRRPWRGGGASGGARRNRPPRGRGGVGPAEARSRQPPSVSPRSPPESSGGAEAAGPPACRGRCPAPQQRHRRGCSRKILSTWMYLLQLACLGSSWHRTHLAVVSKRTQ